MNVRAKKRICEVHHTGLCFGMEKPEEEEGTVPTSGQAPRGKAHLQNQPHEAEGNVCFRICKEV